MGIFKITLPEHMQVKKENERYLLTISKAGYRTNSEYYTPISTNAEIRIDKQ
jgi:hypothetical protein